MAISRRVLVAIISLLLTLPLTGCLTAGVALRTATVLRPLAVRGTTATVALTAASATRVAATRLSAIATSRSLSTSGMFSRARLRGTLNGQAKFHGSINRSEVVLETIEEGATRLRAVRKASVIEVRNSDTGRVVSRVYENRSIKRLTHYQYDGSGNALYTGYDKIVSPNRIRHFDVYGNQIGETILTVTNDSSGALPLVLIATSSSLGSTAIDSVQNNKYYVERISICTQNSKFPVVSLSIEKLTKPPINKAKLFGGNTYFTRTDNRIEAYRIGSNKPFFTIRTDSRPFAASPSGRYVAIVEDKSFNYRIDIYDTQKKSKVHSFKIWKQFLRPVTLRFTSEVGVVSAISAQSGRGYVAFWDLQFSAPVEILRPENASVDWFSAPAISSGCPDRSIVVSLKSRFNFSSADIYDRSTDTRYQVKAFAGHEGAMMSPDLRSIAYAFDDLAMISEGNFRMRSAHVTNIGVFDIVTRNMIKARIERTSRMRDYYFSADGNGLIIRYKDGSSYFVRFNR